MKKTRPFYITFQSWREIISQKFLGLLDRSALGDKQNKMYGLGGSGVANRNLNGVARETLIFKALRENK